jgi:hypothetical protein
MMPETAQFCPHCGTAVTKEVMPVTENRTQPTPVASHLFDRMIRAARLDATLYEEVENDEAATTQALIVVSLSSICSGVGTAINQAVLGEGFRGIGIGLLGGIFTALLVWFAWSLITYFIGTYVFGGSASFGELLRTIGFSDSPGVLLIFSFIPILGGLISFAVWIWGLIAMVVAVRQALDFSTGKAVLTCIVGWIAAIILLVVLGIFLAIPFVLLGT